MDALTPRQQQILDMLASKNRLAIAEIRKFFNVSTATAYRDANRLVDLGLAYRTHGGLQRENTSLPILNQGRCVFCGGSINPRTLFTIHVNDVTVLPACCAHCGFMALATHPESISAMTVDFIYGRMVNVRNAAYLVESIVNFCCTPSVLCFSTPDEAIRFQQGFGGKLLDFGQTQNFITHSMRLHNVHEENSNST
jgi:hypothetical protein